jgi:hypothetical protein
MPKVQKPILPPSVLDPAEDRLLPMWQLGQRWYCHPKVAARRAKDLGLELIRWNTRTLAVRLSDVLKAEREAVAK